MRPLLAEHPANRAGSSHIHRVRSVKVNPRRLASVHITGSATERLEIPPQAVLKFPSSNPFIAGGQGEWSVATKSIVPCLRPCHNASQFSRPRTGGAQLDNVAPSAMFSA